MADATNPTILIAHIARVESCARANYRAGDDPHSPTADALRSACRDALAAGCERWEIAQAVNFDAP